MKSDNEIHLSPRELKTLRKVFKSDGVPDSKMDTEPYDYLLRIGVLEKGFRERFPSDHCDPIFPTNALVVSDLGRAYLAKERRESTRYWITTWIAVAALVLAILSLYTQFLLPEPSVLPPGFPR